MQKLVTKLTYNYIGLLCILGGSGLLSFTAQAQSEIDFSLDLAWDSQYISEGRNNLDDGGIAWAMASINQDNLIIYAVLGRGDQSHYIEWNFGVEYAVNFAENFEATFGYQRLEFYGAERASDNELFSTLTYSGVEWLIPAISYTYSTEAAGYFIEVSLHSPWEITDTFTVTPYVLQGFDFNYVTEEHNGANHFQFGLELGYQFTDNIYAMAHVNHSIALDDIKQQAKNEQFEDDLDQTYAGVFINWQF
ncbi:hypothetical protein [Shewanella gaetbuli]|uniref:Uncharacterized protein n=1 Tax=Shewanella gaetbuli TaxID=220752 RepID=A0A9X1ZMT3_9GAMM|nr:hypothetical protein [Shewanella gaetbuli]MCL1142785.1 hypothetical protein [Shewanella gaetbuli]